MYRNPPLCCCSYQDCSYCVLDVVCAVHRKLRLRRKQFFQVLNLRQQSFSATRPWLRFGSGWCRRASGFEENGRTRNAIRKGTLDVCFAAFVGMLGTLVSPKAARAVASVPQKSGSPNGPVDLEYVVTQPLRPYGDGTSSGFLGEVIVLVTNTVPLGGAIDCLFEVSDYMVNLQ
jgi:hypothetical protein